MAKTASETSVPEQVYFIIQELWKGRLSKHSGKDTGQTVDNPIEKRLITEEDLQTSLPCVPKQTVRKSIITLLSAGSIEAVISYHGETFEIKVAGYMPNL